MTRPFEPTTPRAAYVVQTLTPAGRESFSAPTASQALSKADELLAAGRKVQIFSVERGLISIKELQEIVQRAGETQART